MRIVLLALALAASLIAPQAYLPEAEASCAGPGPGFSPRAGTVMPAKGTLYFFAPRYDFDPTRERVAEEERKRGIERSISIAGATHVARVIAETPFYYVAQIDYQASAAEIEVKTDQRRAFSSSYPIGAAAAPNHTRVLDVSRSKSSWTCSHTNTIDIQLEGNAIAYRLEWSDGTTTVVPYDSRVFVPLWSSSVTHSDDPSPPPRQLIELGHLDCMGANVDPQLFATLRAFRLYALYADGGEQVFRLAGAMLSRDDVRLPFELLEASARPLDAAEGTEHDPELLIPEQPRWRRSLLGGLFGGGALLGLVLLGALFRRLSHRRREHIPRY